LDDGLNPPTSGRAAQPASKHFTVNGMQLREGLSSLDRDEPIAIVFDMYFVLTKSDYQRFRKNPDVFEIKSPTPCPEKVVEKFKSLLRHSAQGRA
jgi:hypothetical protein